MPQALCPATRPHDTLRALHGKETLELLSSRGPGEITIGKTVQDKSEDLAA